MSAVEIGLMIVGMALINLAIRWPVYLFADHVRFPPLIERALAFVPVTVLTAIIVPMILLPDGETVSIDWRNPYLVAGIVAAAISWRWHRLMPTILIGMAVFFAMRWLVESGRL
ncbi:branched-subunit amino acid transport protein [Dongia mobilis]|uniref:Branched-subunit amino acid transport protein n=1 Tax=Dongia mobilis TaxID=578943 RepID=A0A4R6WJG4_9PROT|nr:AzlD domain-containing protein [Dongia mobilis]TDQ80515.1 branched-subunit amino acid transport protein [Dongia mobilis]